MFEAAYAAIKGGYFEKGHKSLPQAAMIAAERILKLFGINNKKAAEEFITANTTSELLKSANDLYNKLTEADKAEFFTALDEANAYVYHCCNFDVSFEYGLRLAGSINFAMKTIIDIGGSSGGLLSGIKSVYPDIRGAVYDTIAACEAGKQLTTEIKYINFDFFSGYKQVDFCDYVVLSNVLHDWSDENCKRILENIRFMLARGTKIIIYEDILFAKGLEPYETIRYGLRLSANVAGGRQRRVPELMSLVREQYDSARLVQFYRYGVHSAMVLDNAVL